MCPEMLSQLQIAATCQRRVVKRKTGNRNNSQRQHRAILFLVCVQVKNNTQQISKNNNS